MAQHASLTEQERLVVHTRPAIDLDEQQFCQLNRDLHIERTTEGEHRKQAAADLEAVS